MPTPKSTKKTETSVPVKLTYTERLMQHIRDNSEINVDDICELIVAFQKQEFEAKKKASDVMPFGKYRGKKVVDVIAFDKPYLSWLSKQEILDNFSELTTNILNAM